MKELNFLERKYFEVIVMKCVGWIEGKDRDIKKLRKLGVTGKMFLRDGAIEHCEVTEEVMSKLIRDRPNFWPGSFTIVDEKRNQLPSTLQKYWRMKP